MFRNERITRTPPECRRRGSSAEAERRVCIPVTINERSPPIRLDGMMRPIRCGLLLGVALLATGATLVGQQGSRGGEWSGHGGDKGYTRYSPLEQINKDNVKNLHIASRRSALAPELLAQYPSVRSRNPFQSTPIMVDGVLYSSNGIGLVEAFDPATGKTIWVQALSEPAERVLTGQSNRGVAYWRSDRDERILSVRDGYLLALDPKTGKLIRSFGDGGKVDLGEYEDSPERGHHSWRSPPLIVRDVVVVGSSSTDATGLLLLRAGTSGPTTCGPASADGPFT
jgi:glucose dehydrogenase